MRQLTCVMARPKTKPGHGKHTQCGVAKPESRCASRWHTQQPHSLSRDRPPTNGHGCLASRWCQGLAMSEVDDEDREGRGKGSAHSLESALWPQFAESFQTVGTTPAHASGMREHAQKLTCSGSGEAGLGKSVLPLLPSWTPRECRALARPRWADRRFSWVGPAPGPTRRCLGRAPRHSFDCRLSPRRVGSSASERIVVWTVAGSSIRNRRWGAKAKQAGRGWKKRTA